MGFLRRDLLCAALLGGVLASILGTAEARDEEPDATEQKEVVLVLGGDTMLARVVSETLREEGPAYPWGDVAPLLREADLAFVNLECVIAEGGEPFQPRRVFYFNADPLAADALSAAGIDGVNLANNHALDYGPDALLEGIGRLDLAGIFHVGAGKDVASAAAPAVHPVGGLRIGFLGFADHFEEYAATAEKPGIHYLPISHDPDTLAYVAARIAAAREAGADRVVVSWHWGPNMRAVPPPSFRSFARAVIDAGADVFHGHSAHVFQGLEIYEGKPILYDTGELVDDYAVDRKLRNDLGLLYRLHLDETGLTRLELVPLMISGMQVNQARGRTVDVVERMLVERSEGFGTRYQREGKRFVVQLD
jgi:poly-gamma-glutamate synthesis protein (capsule biosynthesis protein)